MRSRSNALKHGLCSTVCVPEDLDIVQDRTRTVYLGLKPQDSYQAWMADRVGVSLVRVERCERMERRCRDKFSLRAETMWDDDRRVEVEVLGRSLSARPSETVEALKRTPQGCDWLINLWAQLAHAADTNEGVWSEGQTSLSFDLQGLPASFRLGRKPGVTIDTEGRAIAPVDGLAGFARREIAALKERREVVKDIDEVERALAEVDLNLDSDPEIRRLRRYESMLHHRLRWFIKQVKEPSPNKHLPAWISPSWAADLATKLEPEPIPTPKPEPKTKDEIAAESWTPRSLHPPFCLEPDEYPPPGQKADIPEILKSRKQKRIAKADSRREAKRRKVDKLLA